MKKKYELSPQDYRVGPWVVGELKVPDVVTLEGPNHRVMRSWTDEPPTMADLIVAMTEDIVKHQED